VRRANTLVSGMNLRDAIREARRLGCSVERISGTGEIRVFHPEFPKPIRLNSRRKDSPRDLTAKLRRLAKRRRPP